jgi:hypothetical protein
MKSSPRTGIIILAVAGLAAGVHGQCIMEVEPNDSKSTANPVQLAPGGCIQGNTLGQTGSGAASADWWRIQTTPAPLGIYRHRMVLTSATPGHGPGLWGTTHDAAPPGPWRGEVGTPTTSQVILQSELVDGTERINLWYGFGRSEQMNYRVTGTSSTTADYIATLETEAVTPHFAGTYQAGWITITTIGQGHNTNTDIWVYDSNLQPIMGYGNDGASPLGGYSGAATNVGSFLRREYAAGTYYLALTLSDLCLREGSPSDDNVQNGRCPDFPDVVASRSTSTTPTDVSFAVTDSSGTFQVPASTGEPRGIAWYRLEVVGTIPLGACCLPAGHCADLTPGECEVQSGAFNPNLACGSNTCLPGACCFSTGGCSVFAPVACNNLGGNFQGAETACASTCPTPGDVLLPPNFSAQGGAGPVFTPDYSQVLDVPGNATAFRMSVDALPRTGTGTNVSMQLTLRSPNGTMRVVGGSAALWDQILHSGTRPSGGLAATSFDGFYAHDFGPIAGTWQVNFASTATSGSTLNWTNIRITPVELGNGACCLPAGCEVRATDQCLLAGGSYMGNGTTCTACGVVPCYANCDQSTVAPILNVEDFTCFINEFAAAQGLPHEQQITAYANCDGSTTAPVLNVEDFTCFINEFASGCR